MNADIEAGFRIFTFRDGVGHFAGLQRAGIKGELAGITDERAVCQKLLQLSPPDDGPEFLQNLIALCGDVRIERLLGVVGCKLSRHNVQEIVPTNRSPGVVSTRVLGALAEIPAWPSFAFESCP